MMTLLQIDFPYNGPWGDTAAEAMRGLAEDIAGTPGLKWKIWTESQTTGRAGGRALATLSNGPALSPASHPPLKDRRSTPHSQLLTVGHLTVRTTKPIFNALTIQSSLNI